MKDLVEIALGEYGTREITGKQANPKVVAYFHDIGHLWVKNDERAWCSAFISWVAMRGGYEYSGELTARSWLKLGKEITVPTLGDLAIFWREHSESWKGHLGLYINYSEDRKSIYCLGGNQADCVSIQAYSERKLLGFRRLKNIKTGK